MMKEHICAGCGKKLPAKSITREEACKQGWRFVRIGRGPIHAQCGCMSSEKWSDFIYLKIGDGNNV
jgi:hypothetical protein